MKKTFFSTFLIISLLLSVPISTGIASENIEVDRVYSKHGFSYPTSCWAAPLSWYYEEVHDGKTYAGNLPLTHCYPNSISGAYLIFEGYLYLK
ncbi:hypothetical protein [Chengkuizengella marina]|uniref:Uncharacterized protein n=1 Tax=Chengkuizengella marina TaxID=2507566 RepID=A0A6N9Q605_9BACL|nr:hypothetical protein [Chengkuizengella marina]NBI30200.1 hypothetical protein [Chengkuizengella marina]